MAIRARYWILLFLAACDQDIKLEPEELDEDPVQSELTDMDSDGYLSDEDCNDSQAEVHPGAPELCDGMDNDCDGEVDEEVMTTSYLDADEDGYGDSSQSTEGCEIPAGYVPIGTDCNDSDSDSYPGASERCDELDNDCDGEIDEDITSVWYVDSDGDGYGDESTALEDCDPLSGMVSKGEDCDDHYGKGLNTEILYGFEKRYIYIYTNYIYLHMLLRFVTSEY